MPMPRSVRILIALAVLVLGLAALLLILTISQTSLEVQAHLESAPAWISIAWWGLIAAGGLAMGWLIWRILWPSASAERETHPQREAPSRAAVEAAIIKADERGVDTGAARRELAELTRRRDAGEIHVAFFGDISTGKSSLIKALLPGIEVVANVRGGTTRALQQYRWQSPGGDQLLITDMPGTAEADGHLDKLATDEAKRAHIVVYVTDGDLSRTQHAAMQELLALGKPLVLALNKTDRYTAAELDVLSQRLHNLLAGQAHTALVTVNAPYERDVVVQHADGREETQRRAVPPRVDQLVMAIQRMLDGTQEILDRLRDSATFVLVSQQLDDALAMARREEAERLVDAYAVKAVVGALAAITPGSDLLIQGWLGTRLVRELAAIYDTKVGKVDTELLLQLVQQHVGRAHTLLLAVAGNALKAFPGIGTLAGGAMHAIAYGIVFRTLGRALTTTLATRGELHPRQTAKLFEETLGEDLETSARSLAKMVVDQQSSRNAD